MIQSLGLFLEQKSINILFHSFYLIHELLPQILLFPLQQLHSYLPIKSYILCLVDVYFLIIYVLYVLILIS